jgi:hypothetical protein
LFQAAVQEEDEERNAKVKKDGARKLITYVSEYRGDLKYRLTITDQKVVNDENVSPGINLYSFLCFHPLFQAKILVPELQILKKIAELSWPRLFPELSELSWEKILLS